MMVMNLSPVSKRINPRNNIDTPDPDDYWLVNNLNSSSFVNDHRFSFAYALHMNSDIS